jgi:3-oxoacyl-[acyl-carrier-protein] synthase-1
MKPFTVEPEAVYVVGIGAQTPVGRKALIAAAAVRCGISAYAEHPFMIDRLGEPMVVARADWLDETLPARARITQLGIDAAAEAVSVLEKVSTTIGLAAFLSLSVDNLPEERDQTWVAQQFMASLNQKGIQTQHKIVAEGNAAGAEALALAYQLIQQNPDAICLVGGMDSHLEPERLETIDYSNRLHSANNTWGFTPGEAAGFNVLTSGRNAQRMTLRPLAEVRAVATAKEDKLLGTKTVCIGEGLSSAFRATLTKDELVGHSFCDLNGETYRANEFGFAVCRTSQFFENAGSFTAAAECWGDVGAATVPLQVALATSAWDRGYAKGPVSLCWSSSAHAPRRGAIRLRQCAERKVR